MRFCVARALIGGLFRIATVVAKMPADRYPESHCRDHNIPGQLLTQLQLWSLALPLLRSRVSTILPVLGQNSQIYERRGAHSAAEPPAIFCLVPHQLSTCAIVDKQKQREKPKPAHVTPDLRPSGLAFF